MEPVKEKNKKHLLYLSVYDPHVPFTGAGVRGRHFVSVLSRHLNVDLVYMAGAGQPADEALERRFSGGLDTETKVKIPFSRRGYFLFSKPFYEAALDLAMKKRYSYVLADYGLSARYALRLKKKTGLPFIYCSHNVEFRQYLGKARSDWRRLPLVPYVLGVERAGCRECDILVPISENDARYYERWTSKDKMIVIPQGFDETVFNPHYTAARNKRKVILFFGNYGISTNLEAVHAVRDRIADRVVAEYPDIEFRFIGANPPESIDHAHMKFTGFVDDLAAEIRQADMMISPILAGWGMPTKIIESMACGKPVIATPVAARAIPDRFARLKIRPVEQFAEEIIATLKEDRPVDAADFDLLREMYGWENQILKLVRAIG
jgi:glycosyltransferase involved in cell wall biosynthesis